MTSPIRFADLAITPWRNGAGRKADVTSGEGWMVGFAFLDRDAPFSDLTGHDRTITLVDGDGFELDLAGGTTLRIDRPHVPTRFDGGVPTMCRLLGGPCRVLNAMTLRDVFSHTVDIGGASPETSAGSAVTVLLRGSAVWDGAELAPLDAIRVEGPAQALASEDAVFARIGIVACSPSPLAGSGRGEG